MIEYIDDKAIQALNITSQQYYDWASQMIMTKNEAVLEPKISMKMEGHIFYNVMPCILPQYDVAGVKVVNRYPNNAPSLKSNLMLYDLTNGDLKAIMDANWITTMRTGAVAVHSILLFAKKDFNTISLCGLGNVTKATFRILADMRADKRLTVKLYRYKNHAEELIEEYKDYHNLSFVICDSYQETMRDSDVIVSGITYAEQDFCDTSVYKKGCLIVPIHTLGFQNCDLVFDKVFGDDTAHIQGFKYFDKFQSFAEVCDVVNHRATGRENDEQRILAYNIGIAIHDIYYGNNILQLYKSKL